MLANPPFGRKSSVTVVGEGGRDERDNAYGRPGFCVTTTNQQLNFVQHIANAALVEFGAVAEALAARAADATPD